MGSKKIVVTGASGYIGTSVIPYLVQRGYIPVALLGDKEKCGFPREVEVRAGDTGDHRFLCRAIKDADIVLHLAGFKGYERCLRDVDRAVSANILFTKDILESARKNRVRMIFTSTYWTYGHRLALPYLEDMPLMPSEPYGWSKAIAETMVRSSGLNYAILRLANVFGYGAGKGYDELTALFLKKAMAGMPITLNNAGRHSVDLISVDDVCKAIVAVIGLKDKYLVLNVGSGKPISILKIAELINEVSESLTGAKAKLVKGEDGKDEILFADRWVDASRLKEAADFTPTDIKASLERFASVLLAKGINEKDDKSSKALIS